MGEVRARSDAEVAARRQQILDAAERQLMEHDPDEVTLATIAADLSISRPSLYNYYPNKEEILIDLLVREYRSLEDALGRFLETRLSRETFCEEMADLLLSRKTLLKLLALQLPVFNREFDESAFRRFAQGSASYAKVMREVLAFQFPKASDEERNMFFVQLSLLANTLFQLTELSSEMIDSMVEVGAYDHIPSPRDICIETLMKLSDGM